MYFLKELFYHLLKDDDRYNGFFKLLHVKFAGSFGINSIQQIFLGKICSYSSLDTFITNYPIALAYSLAIINADDENSVCSPWVIHHEPKSQFILEDIRFNNCGDTSCEYCENRLNPRKYLFQYFKFQSKTSAFRLYYFFRIKQ